MSGSTLNKTDKPSGENQSDNVYGLVENILEDLESYELEPDRVSIDVETELSTETLEIEYHIETVEWYESDSDVVGKEPICFNSSYSVNTETAAF